MKILHLSSERTWRGGEQQIAYLIDESSKNNIESIVACRKGSAFSIYCKKENIPFVEIGFKNEVDLFSAYKIKQICKLHHVDIVHAHSSHSQAIGVLSSVLGNKRPIILSRKVDFPIKNNWLSRWKFNHKSIQHIICVSNAIKKIILPDLKNKTHLSVVHDGIDINRFENVVSKNILREEYKISPDKKIIANISAIAPHKDYFTFVDAAQHLLALRKDIHFFIIGDGPLRLEIEAYIINKGLEKNITLTGFRKDVPDIFKEIDVFLMTSETEGLGSTLLDAAANRIPIVATKAGGIPEFVVDQKTGLLSNIKDSKNLALQVSNLLDNKQLKEVLTEAAYQKLISGFTKEIMAQKTFKIYGKINSIKRN